MLSKRAQRLGHPSALGSPSACMSWFITTRLPLQGTSHSLKAVGQQTCTVTLCQDCRTLCQSPLYMHLMMLSERAQRLGHPSALGSPSACMSWFITTHLPLQGTSHSLKAIGQQTCTVTLCQDCRTLCQSPLYMHLMMLSERAQRLGHPSALGSPSACMSWFITTHLPLQGTSHSLKAIGQQTCTVTLCQDCRTLCQSPLYMHLMMLSERAQRLGHPSALGSPTACMSWFITTHLPLQGTSHSLKAIGQQTCTVTLCQDCRTLCQSPLYMHLMMLSERAQRLGHPSALGSPSACMSWFITTHLPLQGTSHSLKAIGQQTCTVTLCQDCRTLCQSPLYMHLMMLSERAQRLGHPSALGSPSACMSWFITTHLPLQGTSHSLKAIGQQTCTVTLCQDCRTLCQSPLYMHLMMLSERAQRWGHPSALGSPSACMSWFITTHLPLEVTSHLIDQGQSIISYLHHVCYFVSLCVPAGECVVLGKAAKQLDYCESNKLGNAWLIYLGLACIMSQCSNRTTSCNLSGRRLLTSYCSKPTTLIVLLLSRLSPIHMKLKPAADCPMFTIACLHCVIHHFTLIHTSLAGISWILYAGSSISWGKHADSGLYPASILACSSQRADGVNLESFSFNLEVVEHNKKPSKQMHQRSYNYIQPPCLSSQSPQAIWVAKQRQLDSYGFSQAGHLHKQKISQFVTFTRNMTIENEKRGEQMMKNWEQRAWKSCYMVALCSGSFDQHGGGNHCTSITRTSSSIIQQRRQELKAQLRAVWQIAVHTCGCSSLARAMSKTLEWCFLDSPGGASTTRGYTSLAVQRLSCRDVSNELSKLFRLEIPLHIPVACFFGFEYWLQIATLRFRRIQ